MAGRRALRSWTALEKCELMTEQFKVAGSFQEDDSSFATFRRFTGLLCSVDCDGLTQSGNRQRHTRDRTRGQIDRRLVAIVLADVHLEHSAWCRFSALRPLQIDQVRTDVDLTESGSPRLNAKDLLHKPRGHSGGPSVGQACLVTRGVVGLERGVKILLIPGRIVSFPETGCAL